MSEKIRNKIIPIIIPTNNFHPPSSKNKTTSTIIYRIKHITRKIMQPEGKLFFSFILFLTVEYLHKKYNNNKSKKPN